MTETQRMQLWQALADAVGGITAIGRVCKVDRKTVQRWRDGKHSPNAITQETVNRIARDHGCEPVFPEVKQS